MTKITLNLKTKYFNLDIFDMYDPETPKFCLWDLITVYQQKKLEK